MFAHAIVLPLLFGYELGYLRLGILIAIVVAVIGIVRLLTKEKS